MVCVQFSHSCVHFWGRGGVGGTANGPKVCHGPGLHAKKSLDLDLRNLAQPARLRARPECDGAQAHHDGEVHFALRDPRPVRSLHTRVRNDPPSPYNTSLTGQFLWQVSRSREWAHPVGKVVFNSMEDGGCCCGVVGWTNAKAGAAAAARKQVVEAADAPILACG